MQLSTVTNLKTNKIETNKGISPLVDNFSYEKDLVRMLVPNPKYVTSFDLEEEKENIVPCIYQLNYDIINKKPSICMLKEPFKKEIKINNTFDLHDYILNNVQSTLVDTSLNTNNNDLYFSVFVNRQSNIIAQKTKRGAANVCIINEKNLDLIETQLVKDNEGFDYSHTYQYVGSLNGVSVYTDKTNLLSENYAIICYNNNNNTAQDSGLYCVVDDNSDVWLTQMKSNQISWTDYFSVLKIKR